jgi:hypothetical protein
LEVQFSTSNKEIMGFRTLLFAFTEHGLLMLAGVLNSERALQINQKLPCYLLIRNSPGFSCPERK